MERTYETAAALVGRADGPLAGHLGAFVTGASISNGKETAMMGILNAMLINQMIVVSGGGAFGAGATTGLDAPGVDDKELATARALGQRIAEVALIAKRGST